MATPSTPRNLAAKSKTDLRRGSFTPEPGGAKKTAPAPRRGTGAGTSNLEQAFLFDEEPGGAK